MKNNPLKCPPSTQYNFLSLGGGVQSSALALMAAHGEIGPMPDAAIFADTKAEPKSVYTWLEWLIKELPFPVYIVSRGSLTAKALEMRTTKDGRKFSKSDIPIFTRNADGSHGMVTNRSCTADFKIQPIRKKVRELAEIKRGQKEITVTQWIGISWDEIQRIKESRDAWQQNRWPLIELKITREQCKQWMKDHGYPEPPRSSCVYCPFHSDNEWRRLRDEEPESFQAAIDFDKNLRAIKGATDTLKSTPYVHRQRVPLDEVNLDTIEDRGQMTLIDFQSECEGMCGV